MLPYWMKKKKKKDKDPDLFPRPVVKKSRSNLVARLDKVFALYIRLRDVMPSGYGKCISCGKIKPFNELDCGHFHGRTHMGTRWEEDNCHAECISCLTPDALILTKDLIWVKLGDLKVGDELFGFSEESSKRDSERRKWQLSVVTHIHREVKDVFEVELENGDKIKTTADHKWLIRDRGFGFKWLATEEMWINGMNVYGKRKTGPHTERTTTVVCKPIQVIEQDLSYESGWLAGMIDADGHITQQNIHNPDGSIRFGLRIGVAQSETYPYLIEEIIRLIEKFTDNNKPCRQSMMKSKSKLVRNVPAYQYLVTGTNVEKLQFLMKVRPKKMRKIDINKLGMIKSQYDTKVKSIKPVGKQEIVVMETSTHTFIANGYMMHNCNRMSADHIIGYRDNLIAKIGMSRYETLKLKAKCPKHWLDSELQEKIDYYRKEVKRLSAEKGIRVNL